MTDDQNERAKELLRSSGSILFYKEQQLIKDNRFPEAVAILRKRLRRMRLLSVISVVLVTSAFVASLLFDTDHSWVDYVPVGGVLLLVISMEVSNRRLDGTLDEVESMF